MAARIIVSDWAALEVSSVMALRARIGAITKVETTDLLIDFDVWRRAAATLAFIQSEDIARAMSLVRRGDLVLRGPDAIHIAIAERLNATLLTFDKGMSAAAKAIGLNVANQPTA